MLILVVLQAFRDVGSALLLRPPPNSFHEWVIPFPEEAGNKHGVPGEPIECRIRLTTSTTSLVKGKSESQVLGPRPSSQQSKTSLPGSAQLGCPWVGKVTSLCLRRP